MSRQATPEEEARIWDHLPEWGDGAVIMTEAGPVTVFPAANRNQPADEPKPKPDRGKRK